MIALNHPTLYLEPHPTLHGLRQSDPVHWSPDLSAWLLLRYDDVTAGMRDRRLMLTGMSKRIDELPPPDQQSLVELRRSVEKWMGLPTIDDHQRYSKLLRPYFSQRSVQRFAPQITTIARNLIDEMGERDGGDIVNDFAYPFTTEVIAHVIGLPADNRSALISWSRDIREVFHASDAAGLRKAQHALTELADYLRTEMQAPRDDTGEDLISLFLGGLEDGLIHHEDEIVANLVMMVAVGFETTSNLLASGTAFLLENPAYLHRLQQEPALIGGAIEEMARLEGPVFVTTRVVAEDLEIGSKAIRAGDIVMLCLAAANRDPDVFTMPDELIPERSPNRHLGFGAGAYSCVGAHLARLNLRIGFEQMLWRMPKLELDQEPEWYEFHPLARWLGSLRVHC